MPVDPIYPISETSQSVADQDLKQYLTEKKIIADEQVTKAVKIQETNDIQEAKDHKKIEDEKFQEARSIKADQAELYQIEKETNKQALEAKYAKMDAVTNANASHFHAAEVNSKAAQDKASATIEQNTVAFEDFLAAKTSKAEINRRADNAAASESANTNILNSESETKLAIETYHDNMAKQSTLQTVNAIEAARLAGAPTLTIRQDKSPTPHINVMD
jgi:hypothetical protein